MSKRTLSDATHSDTDDNLDSVESNGDGSGAANAKRVTLRPEAALLALLATMPRRFPRYEETKRQFSNLPHVLSLEILDGLPFVEAFCEVHFDAVCLFNVANQGIDSDEAQLLSKLLPNLVHFESSSRLDDVAWNDIPVEKLRSLDIWYEDRDSILDGSKKLLVRLQESSCLRSLCIATDNGSLPSQFYSLLYKIKHVCFGNQEGIDGTFPGVTSLTIVHKVCQNTTIAHQLNERGQLASMELVFLYQAFYQQLIVYGAADFERLGIGHENCVLRQLSMQFYCKQYRPTVDIFVPISKCKYLETVSLRLDCLDEENHRDAEYVRQMQAAVQTVLDQGLLLTCNLDIQYLNEYHCLPITHAIKFLPENYRFYTMKPSVVAPSVDATAARAAKKLHRQQQRPSAADADAAPSYKYSVELSFGSRKDPQFVYFGGVGEARDAENRTTLLLLLSIQKSANQKKTSDKSFKPVKDLPNSYQELDAQYVDRCMRLIMNDAVMQAHIFAATRNHMVSGSTSRMITIRVPYEDTLSIVENLRNVLHEMYPGKHKFTEDYWRFRGYSIADAKDLSQHFADQYVKRQSEIMKEKANRDAKPQEQREKIALAVHQYHDTVKATKVQVPKVRSTVKKRAVNPKETKVDFDALAQKSDLSEFFAKTALR